MPKVVRPALDLVPAALGVEHGPLGFQPVPHGVRRPLPGVEHEPRELQHELHGVQRPRRGVAHRPPEIERQRLGVEYELRGVERPAPEAEHVAHRAAAAGQESGWSSRAAQQLNPRN